MKTQDQARCLFAWACCSGYFIETAFIIRFWLEGVYG
jgi:hypothetical protein